MKKFLIRIIVLIIVVGAFVGGIAATQWEPTRKALEVSGVLEEHQCPQPEEPILTPDFEIIDNGDGTFTLKPKGGTE